MRCNSTGARLAVKDNIASLGSLTTCDSNILAGTAIPFDATIVSQLRSRGFSVVGKTGMDEFGMGTHSTTGARGIVRNAEPLQDFSAGGSSGGSAVSVSKGEAEIALGTDTGGSVRMPAAYTGTVGFKPSYGMLSRFGVVPYANSLDTVGLLAKTVTKIRDLLIGTKLFAEHDHNDPTSLPVSVRQRCTAQRTGYDGQARSTLRGITFGLPIEYNVEELNSSVRDGWIRAAQIVEDMGGRVVPVSLPTTRMALSAYYVIAPAEAASNLAKYDGIRYGRRNTDTDTDAPDGVLYAKTRASGFGKEVKRRILLGSYSLSSEAVDNYFIQAQKVRQLVRRDFDRVFKLSNPLRDEQPFDLSDMDESVVLENKLGPTQVDFLLCPTAPTTPPLLEEVLHQTPLDSYMNDVFTVPASLAGLPAISVPMGLASPAQDGEESKANFGGLQLIGQYWDDARLLSVAELVSRAVDTR
ncbi:amidase signature domain-containing protein [Microdochium trichocladiopsis]|uniref:Glutamyl-tRNA(Gln) amidotransferase subunit A, mitochondrial n=1 Tax=Microdochium trichocladiopsis TaxID=1682393 RepID=A0A9P8YBE7_9PEZI|nr:amidase signature domain-containing protein [Microdochium trichocladiopsis]KAH7037606.1 amidase signature domain-containing protein [Microdochium trichocladiopsis]